MKKRKSKVIAFTSITVFALLAILAVFILQKPIFGLGSKKNYVTQSMAEVTTDSNQSVESSAETTKTEQQSTEASPKRKIDKEKKLIAFTFDDGPSEYTSELLDVLNANDSKATFCVLGSRISSHKEELKKMQATGHEIASHTQNHKQLTSLSPQALNDEINKTETLIVEVTGESPRFMRPPYGAMNKNVRNAAGTPLLMWNVDTLDWKTRNADKVYNHVVNNAKDGDIVLFHDIYPSTLEANKRLIPYLNKNGFQLVTVSELLEAKGIKPENGKAYFSVDVIN